MNYLDYTTNVDGVARSKDDHVQWDPPPSIPGMSLHSATASSLELHGHSTGNSSTR